MLFADASSASKSANYSVTTAAEGSTSPSRKKKRPNTDASSSSFATDAACDDPTAGTTQLASESGASMLGPAQASCTENAADVNGTGQQNSTGNTKRPRSSAEQTAASKEKHPLLPPCSGSCKRKCNNKFSHSRRVDIYEEFWSKSYDTRRAFIFSHIDQVSVQRRRAVDNSRNLRGSSYRYKLPTDDGNVFVCKTFFLHTLGFNSDKVITCLMRENGPNVLTPGISLRGKNKPSNCVDEAVIIEHINSFHPQISHYRREHAPRRRYLSPEITVRLMFADFETKHPKFCSYDKYRRVLQQQNISFCKLGEEECEFCLMHANHKCDSQTRGEECQECQEILEHKQVAENIRKLYTKDRDTVSQQDRVFWSVDLQKVMLLPRLPGVKSSIFTRRLVVFHETFAPLKSLANTVSVLWHEGISGRSAGDIASTFICAMKQAPGVAHFTLWMDNCTAQNKNWTIFTAMVTFVNSKSGPQSVTFKYLMSGHTFMSADAFHASVEKQFRAQKNLYDFGDLTDGVTKAGKSVKVVTLEATDFRKWKSGAYKTRASDRPLIGSLHQVRFTKGSRCIYYKLKPEDDERQYDFLTKKHKLAEPVSLDGNRGIADEKKREIIAKLCPLMPEDKKVFWYGLHTSGAAAYDLLDGDDDNNVAEN